MLEKCEIILLKSAECYVRINTNMEVLMTLTREGYRTRLIDEKITRYLRIFGAISVEGPKWCGKTWTSLNHANSVSFLTTPDD